MAKDFQDIQQLDSEENDHQLGGGEGPGTRRSNSRREDAFWKGTPPPQPLLLQSLHPRPWLNLLVLGFNLLLLVAICVIGSQRAQMQGEFWTLKQAFSNFSSSTLAEIQALSFHGSSTGDRVTALEAKLEKQKQDLKADHDTLLFHLKHFPFDLRILACQLAFLRSNGTECCPINWLEHDGSCYWFSRTGLTWPEAQKFCQLENAHLVVVNSREEQKFIVQHSQPFHTWIGLTETDGSWKWVDGTDYSNSYKNWNVAWLDNWRGHEQGGSEDCAEVQADGRWSHNFCQQVQRWTCEMRRNITG
ncbi:asialoglycoprotein receptor 2 [Phyllostomus discolor]|uniref:Asialoglycoprotein receptor 2 n=1 Tax=Phyllostomus discolor TaxID=89673 RepID=A0A7E6EBN9_9CHIR|nr:asialoglycoprotein receptor 2 isoform X1 [Phyllostomus discolor]XP_035889041.1 asialoglycoprotein receptor 2 isoform X1 [Phyllostomus discolor]KAF6092323.1 asialoglycoprotein receptor 2 [Phyllostomus discolor]